MWRTRVGEYTRRHPCFWGQWGGQDKLKLAVVKLCSLHKEPSVQKGEKTGKVATGGGKAPCTCNFPIFSKFSHFWKFFLKLFITTFLKDHRNWDCLIG